MTRSLKWFALTLCVSTLLPIPLQAQNFRCTTAGTVGNPSGAVAASASVTVTNRAIGLTRTVFTLGVHAVRGLEPGTQGHD
jgi:hypothetical protein